VATVLGLLVLIHTGAALRHHFWLKDDVLRRMLPGALFEHSAPRRQARS
jgi:cytochrome b561